MARSVVYTIGYEGASPEALVAALAAAGIATLVDVRAVAGSRRKAFCKGALRDTLAAAGIGYVHLPGLGTPKEGRDAARAGREDAFRRVFARHMETDAFADDFGRLAELVRGQGPVCLMCLERDPARCHRTIVADALAGGTGARIEALIPARAGDTGALF